MYELHMWDERAKQWDSDGYGEPVIADSDDTVRSCVDQMRNELPEYEHSRFAIYDRVEETREEV